MITAAQCWVPAINGDLSDVPHGCDSSNLLRMCRQRRSSHSGFATWERQASIPHGCCGQSCTSQTWWRFLFPPQRAAPFHCLQLCRRYGWWILDTSPRSRYLVVLFLSSGWHRVALFPPNLGWSCHCSILPCQGRMPRRLASRNVEGSYDRASWLVWSCLQGGFAEKYEVTSHEVAPMCGFDVFQREVASGSGWCRVYNGMMSASMLGPGSSVRSLMWFWDFIRWMGMAYSVWRDWNWWMWRWWKVARVSILGLVHKGLDTGFDCVLHLFHHLFRIEGCTGSSLCGWRCHWCWWFWRRRCWLWNRWSGSCVRLRSGLMERNELLKVLNIRLSLWRKLLI